MHPQGVNPSTRLVDWAQRVAEVNRLVLHPKMENLSVKGMRSSNFFVKLDSETWSSWRYHPTFLPLHRCLQQLSVEPTPILNALQNQEVRSAGGQLHIGSPNNGPAIEMGCDLSVVDLR